MIVVRTVTWPFRFVAKMAARSMAMAVLSVVVPLAIVVVVAYALVG